MNVVRSGICCHFELLHFAVIVVNVYIKDITRAHFVLLQLHCGNLDSGSNSRIQIRHCDCCWSNRQSLPGSFPVSLLVFQLLSVIWNWNWNGVYFNPSIWYILMFQVNLCSIKKNLNDKITGPPFSEYIYMIHHK